MTITPVKTISTIIFTFGYLTDFTTGCNSQEVSKSQSIQRRIIIFEFYACRGEGSAKY